MCGGEQKGTAAFISDTFLSHLCGGELGAMTGSMARAFLSHLCGGEPSAAVISRDYRSSPPHRWLRNYSYHYTT
jgi:hypothetical protein